MKRSNQLLIGLLIAIFILPLGLFMAFKSIVKKGKYTVIDNHMNDRITDGKTGHYNVVKISFPEFKNSGDRKILTCHLHSAKEGRYKFQKNSTIDSISVSSERDTLFITYVIKPHQKSPTTYFIYQNVDLYLPDMKNIVVDGATIQMDSIDAVSNPDIGIHLTDAILQLGDGINNEDENKPFEELPETGLDESEAPPKLKYGNLSVTARASQLIFGYHLQIDSLSLNIEKDSRLIIANGFQARQVNGAVSDEATITSDIQTIKMLGSLNSR